MSKTQVFPKEHHLFGTISIITTEVEQESEWVQEL